jgi:hypothetical protein
MAPKKGDANDSTPMAIFARQVARNSPGSTSAPARKVKG